MELVYSLCFFEQEANAITMHRAIACKKEFLFMTFYI